MIRNCDKELPDKAFNIAKNSKYDGYHQEDLIQQFAKKAHTSGGAVIQNHQLVGELHQPVTRKFGREKYTYILKTLFGVLILWICIQ